MKPHIEHALDCSLLRLLHFVEARGCHAQDQGSEAQRPSAREALQTACPEVLELWLDSRAKSRFWQARRALLRLSEQLSRPFPAPPFTLSRPDFSSIASRFDSDAFFAAHQLEIHIATEKREVQTEYAVQSAMEEKSPQFFLRNVPRVQRDVELSQALRFDEDENERHRAYALIQEVREAHIPRPEMAEIWTSALSTDFRIFLEEVLFLCPWEEMPRQLATPSEDSTWSPKHSRAKLTYELMDRKHKVFVFGHQGTPQSVRRHAPKRLAKVRSLTPLDGNSHEPMA
ncbi:MAG: hypothetical protein RBU37_24465 [Myxococcota bacterium]|jgi:hypothetical protein|nr:hypothetical protein [Myxococcota bacterium]